MFLVTTVLKYIYYDIKQYFSLSNLCRYKYQLNIIFYKMIFYLFSFTVVTNLILNIKLNYGNKTIFT